MQPYFLSGWGLKAWGIIDGDIANKSVQGTYYMEALIVKSDCSTQMIDFIEKTMSAISFLLKGFIHTIIPQCNKKYRKTEIPTL